MCVCGLLSYSPLAAAPVCLPLYNSLLSLRVSVGQGRCVAEYDIQRVMIHFSPTVGGQPPCSVFANAVELSWEKNMTARPRRAGMRSSDGSGSSPVGDTAHISSIGRLS